MSRQLTMYWNAGIERELLDYARSIGLEVHPAPGAPRDFCLGSSGPPESGWPFAGEFIQFSRPDEPGVEARLWFDPVDPAGQRKSGKLAKAFEGLRRFVTRTQRYYEPSGVWAHKMYSKEFEASEEQRQRDLEDLVRKNRRIAEQWAAGSGDDS